MKLELPLLRLGTDGATAIEVGGDIVRARAPGMLPKTLNGSASSNNANTANERLNPSTRFAKYSKKHFLKVEG